ncbi:hypothetical protein WA171_006334 [Blastocystis sp. BT1]
MSGIDLREKLLNNEYQMKYYQLQKNLRKTMRILLDDGRVVEGRLQCFDSSLNMIFVNAVEVLSDSELTHPIGRLIISDCTIKQYQPCPCA